MHSNPDRRQVSPAPAPTGPAARHSAPARRAFLVSDATGHAAQVLARALLAQFDGPPLREVSLSGVDSFERLYAVVDAIRCAREQDGAPPLVIATLANEEHAQALRTLDCVFIDVFAAFLPPCAQALGTPPRRRVREALASQRLGERQARMAAIDFALAHDDGASAARLAEAEVVLVGVSRCGKTPTCLYLAMQHGVKAANCPLTPDDFARGCLPGFLLPVRDRLVGLAVPPQRLEEVRSRRMPGSRYAAPDTCAQELAAAARLMRREGIPCVDAGDASVEELAAAVLRLRQPKAAATMTW